MCAFSSLDNLVANGVLNFDADAYVRGEAPRYYGNPFGSQAMPFDQPITPYPYASPYYGGGYAPVMAPQPSVDAYINRHEHSSTNSLKELLGYTFVGGLIIYGIHKLNKLGGFFKDKFDKIFTKKSSEPKKAEPVKPEGANAASGKNAAENLANAAGKEGNWFKRNIWNKKFGGWTLGIVAVLGALAVLRSMFRKKPQQLTPEQMQMMSQQLQQAQAQPTDPAAAQAQVAAVAPAPVEAAPPVQVAQAQPAPVPAPTVEVAQQEPVPEIQPVPPVQA